MRSTMYVLADDDLADLVHEAVDEGALLGDELVQGADVVHGGTPKGGLRGRRAARKTRETPDRRVSNTACRRRGRPTLGSGPLFPALPADSAAERRTDAVAPAAPAGVEWAA